MNWIERGWYQSSKLVYVLAPLSILFFVIYKIRMIFFKFGILKQVSSPVPVIVVGNISVGGTGKTPFVIYLSQILQEMGYKPGIVSRGYGAKSDDSVPFPRLVTEQLAVEMTGDEPKLLMSKTSVPVVISPDRPAGVALLSKKLACDVVISDDGLQHYQMGRSLEIVIVDKMRQFGNGWLLPVGPLREPKSRLTSADLVINNSGFSNSGDYIQQSGDIKDMLSGQRVDPSLLSRGVNLVSGIGNPKRFEQTVSLLGFPVKSTNWFDDHHPFTAEDFNQFSDQDIIVMTEKDAIKCQGFAKPNWCVLPISAVISPELDAKIKQLINEHCK